jgi:hypothetical protein
MNKEWKEVPGYEGIYEVSDAGDIRSIKGFGYKDRKISKHRNGYLQIMLHRNKVSINHMVHRLVMSAFVGPSELAVDHINGEKTDNRLSNLRYCTDRQNQNFGNKSFKVAKSSKYIGVTWNETSRKWQASININGRRQHLGVFDDEHEASECYQDALKDFYMINPSFQDWINANPILSTRPLEVYRHLQANPHLLKEDGEKNKVTIIKEEQREIGQIVHHSEDKLDMPHTFKPGDKVMVVSNEASTANERCGPHHFKIGQFVKLLQWNNYSVSWDALGFGQSWNIAPADIEPIK